MNFLAWPLSLSILVFLLTQAVTFHKATVCRQEAWLKSTELYTRTLLTRPQENEQEWHLGCKLHLNRNGKNITWQRLPVSTRHHFTIKLEGKL